jgi:hypothetical protein
MSDSSDPSSPKPRPASERRRASGAARKPPGRRPSAERNRSKVESIIQVVGDESSQQLSPVDRLKKEAKTGIPGIAVSTAVHAFVLLVMALFVIRIDIDTEGPLSFGWDVEVEKEEATPTVMAPVRIQSVQLTPRSEPKPAERTEPKVDTKPKIARTVKPADVASFALPNERRERLAVLAQRIPLRWRSSRDLSG